ncbi:MAG TPA: hypothetical protein VGF06_06285 [Terriglobales bacterium]|jgi:chorismate mutase
MESTIRASISAEDVHVQEVLRSAQSELRALLAQRAEVMKRIGSIKQTINGLASIFGEGLLGDELLTLLDRKSSRRPGFTRACRAVLMEAPGPLTVREVCVQLRKKFPGLLERHKEPIASATTVLSRLVAYEEVRSFVNSEGRRVWQWTTVGPELGLISAFPPNLTAASGDA